MLSHLQSDPDYFCSEQTWVEQLTEVETLFRSGGASSGLGRYLDQ